MQINVALPHGTLTITVTEDGCYPGVEIALDGSLVYMIEELCDPEDERRQIQHHFYDLQDDDPKHTIVLKTL